MIDQAETFLSKTDNTLNKHKDTPTHSNHASQEANNYHQQKMLDENQLNDDHCFKCNKKGQLYCCDHCFRAFHKACINTKRFSKFWNCEYCLQHKLCAECQLPKSEPQFDKSQLICTICFRFVHRLCCQVPEEVLNSYSHFFIGSDNFVCKGCIRQYGYKFVLTFSKKQAENDKIYYFVNINTRSPIHCGWFDEIILKQVPQKEEDKFKEVQVFQVPKVAKILRMKVPQSRKPQDYQQIINQLILMTNTSQMKESCYGGSDNFYFFVVWEGSDYTRATWEDQKVLQYSDKQKSQFELVKYLLYKKLELTLRDKRPLHSIKELFNKYLVVPSPSVEFRLSDLLNQFLQTNSNLSYILSGDSYSQTIDFVCYFIQQFYSQDLTQQPILIICGGSVGRWQRRLQELCPQLNIVTLKGSEAHIYELKQKEVAFQLINRVKCHVIILPIQRWLKEKKFISNKQFHFSHIIFDELVSQNIFQELQLERIGNYHKQTFIIDRVKKNTQKLYFRNRNKMYKQIDVELQIMGYDLAANKVVIDMQLQKQSVNISSELDSVVNENWQTFDKKSHWKELERCVFLRFILAFGIHYTGGEMFEKLFSFSKGSFSGDERDKFYFHSYSKLFLAALSKIPTQTAQLRYYFFNLKVNFVNIQPESIYKRILKLNLLKSQVDRCKHCPEKFRAIGNWYIFQGIRSACMKVWQPKHDYILSALILEKGFGKWTEIAQTKDWVKWISSCHFQQNIQMKRLSSSPFSEYVKKILQTECQKEGLFLRNLQQILRERGENILADLDKE